ncbi:Glycosyltransferase family 90 protein [Aspergillus sclerotialis]|uniref:Glycosyltransferase family 90 protein n=1 Tax=Aspergillus sclerotialis TaxID=2070753 RepID=A0A3A2ZR55_9EURO|nr:Glycosyltransferase family 90 protein [Aspergillus sclerotialis]
MEKATHEFHETLNNQSETYIAADEEYRRRYRIEPPPGFEEWFQFASAHQSPIIDDFDVIYSSIRPFLNLSGREINENLNNARNLPNKELWSCTFFGSSLKTECSHDNLNHLDEPRVILPTPIHIHDGVNIKDQSKQATWNPVSNACAHQIDKSQTKEPHPVSRTEPELPFVTDPALEKDLCLHPEYSRMHGLFLSPKTFRPIEGLLPVLSPGSPSTMGDVLFPCPAYVEPEFQYNANKDIDWEKKQNKLYWAGSTTGGYAVNEDWRQFQRQRFVSLAQNLERRHYSYLYQNRDGSINIWKSTFLNSRLFDVAISRLNQCEIKYCRDEMHYFDIHSWADKDRYLQSRLVFDLDGNGISGRFYSLLASKSAVLKQTLLREWHDDRLKPWVHYIPVSQSMEELPEMVRYFTSKKGQEKAREIAENGRDWFSKSFRQKI